MEQQGETKQEFPMWFTGQIYDEGAEVTNKFSGEKFTLNRIELSIYDFIMGANHVGEAYGWPRDLVEDMRKGLAWFRKNNPEAYMKLLD